MWRTGKNLDQNIIDGANDLMRSSQLFLGFSQLYESSETTEISPAVMQDKLAAAVVAIEQAESEYREIVTRTQAATYDSAIQRQLIEFNYARYARKNRLNRDLFAAVAIYGKSGDIKGMYAHIDREITRLKWSLYKLQDGHEVKRIWRITED